MVVIVFENNQTCGYYVWLKWKKVIMTEVEYTIDDVVGTPCALIRNWRLVVTLNNYVSVYRLYSIKSRQWCLSYIVLVDDNLIHFGSSGSGYNAYLY